jgi:hypothetical protein
MKSSRHSLPLFFPDDAFLAANGSGRIPLVSKADMSNSKRRRVGEGRVAIRISGLFATVHNNTVNLPKKWSGTGSVQFQSTDLTCFFRDERYNLLRSEQNTNLNEGESMPPTQAPLYCLECHCQHIEAHRAIPSKKALSANSITA